MFAASPRRRTRGEGCSRLHPCTWHVALHVIDWPLYRSERSCRITLSFVENKSSRKVYRFVVLKLREIDLNRIHVANMALGKEGDRYL